MAGWLKRVDGSGLESFQIQQEIEQEKKQLCLDRHRFSRKSVNNTSATTTTIEVLKDTGYKLEPWFNDYLPVFLQETFGSWCLRPLPLMLGDGQSVDFFKLYLDVHERGGFEKFSKNGLWDSVARECGRDSSFSSALKLVYVKHLDTLYRFLQRLVGGEDLGGETELTGSDYLGDLSMGLESDSKGSLPRTADENKKDGEFRSVELKKKEFDFERGGKFARLDELGGSGKLTGEETTVIEDVAKGRVLSDKAEGTADDEDRLFEVNIEIDRTVKGGDAVVDLSGGNEDVLSRKRRRECYLGMLNWINRVAMNPCDPAIGLLPDTSKWKYYATDLVWKRVLIVREAMLLKRDTESSVQEAMQKKRKMHPSMYDDQIGSESQRLSQRLLSAKEPSKKSRAQILSESCSSGTQSDEDFEETASDLSSDLDPTFVGSRRYQVKHIPVGPRFQAEVPEWTGVACESDPKWLGTQFWPLERVEQNRNLIERERIGKGRQDSCGCQLPGSFECVRFHISEKRTRVKLELGPAFYRWKFDNMGEEVAFSWTIEEEEKFRNIAKSNPLSLGKRFWHEVVESFANKGTESLVSYYFNVFLLQRRGCQNRVSPNDIKSDDEESESRYDSAKRPGSIFCSPKKHLNVG